MTLVRLDPTDPARVVLEVPDRELELAHQVPGSLWDKHRKVFTARLSWATWMALQGVFGQLLQVADDFGQWTRDEYARRVEPCLAVRQALDVTDPEHFDSRLRPFQRPGVAMLACAGQMVLADDLGSGKTIQSIVALRRLAEAGHEVFPVVCVVPNSVKAQWADEWATWWPEPVEVRVVGGGAAKRRQQLTPGADVYVLNWEAVRYHSRLAPYGSLALKKCGDHRHGDPDLKTSLCEVHEKELLRIGARSVIVDEAHRMKDPKSKQTRAVWAVQHGASVRWRFALTGTPVADHPGDLWSILHGIAPEEYPSRTDYIDRYCLNAWSYFGGLDIIGLQPGTRDEFLGFFDPRFRRLPKELVLPDLPPVQYVTRYAELSAKQRRAYRELEEHHLTRDEDGHLLVTPNSLTEQLRLLQYASATCEVADGEVRLGEPSPKLDVLLEVLRDTERPVAVAAASRKLIELTARRLEKHDVSHVQLVGGLTDDQRAAVLRDFREGRARVLLFTMQAGGEGVNMTEADTLVRLDRSWSMLLNRQVVGRVHRIGSERHESITVIDVVAPDTVEESQLGTLRRKEARLEEIVRDKVVLLANAAVDSTAAAQLASLEAEERTLLESDLRGEP